MLGNIKKILESKIAQYIIPSVATFFLNGIKDRHNSRKKEKELKNGIINFRKVPTFRNIVIKIYIGLMIIVVALIIVQERRSLRIGNVPSHIITSFCYFIFSTLYILSIVRGENTRKEFSESEKDKRNLIVAIWLIYGIAFSADDYIKHPYVLSIVLTIALLIWMYKVKKYCEIVWMLRHKYVDIYLKNGDIIKNVEAENITIQGGWIIIDRNGDGYYNESRIILDEIEEIESYGEPVYKVEKCSFI